MLRISCVAAALALAMAAPAAAQTVLVEGPVVHVGPVFDGTGVTWGEEPGGATVVRSVADGVVRERARLPRPQDPRTVRGFSSIGGDLAASAQWLGFVASTARNLPPDGDPSAAVGSRALWFGAATAPRLTGRGGSRLEPTAVAADGAAFAWGETRRSALRRRRDVHTVHVSQGGVIQHFHAGRGDFSIRRVRVAGPYVGWSLADESTTDRVVVADRRTGRVVLRLRASTRLQSGRPYAFYDFDLQADGAVVVTFVRRRPGARGLDVGVATPALQRLRTIARGAAETVELAGGRVAYALRRPTFAHRGHAVVPLAGGARHVIPPGSPGNASPLGAFDWDGRRLVWAEVDGADEFTARTGRIWVRDVP